MSVAPTSVSTTEASSFEALFHRVLKPEGEFLRDLRAAGYDPEKPELRYPTQVWHTCIEIARRHTYPQLPPDQGFRQLGLRYMKGWYATLIGKLVSAAMPMLGLERTLARVPRAWKGSQPTFEVEIIKEAEKQWRLVLREPGVIAEFCAGLLEGGADPVGHPVKVVVLETSPLHCVLRVTG